MATLNQKRVSNLVAKSSRVGQGSDTETTRAEIEASLARISRSYISNLRQLRNHYDPENENRPKSEPNRTTKFIPIQPMSHIPQNHLTSTSGHMIATNNHVTNHKVPVGNHGNYIHANFNTEEYENGALLRFEHDLSEKGIGNGYIANQKLIKKSQSLPRKVFKPRQYHEVCV